MENSIDIKQIDNRIMDLENRLSTLEDLHQSKDHQIQIEYEDHPGLPEKIEPLMWEILQVVRNRAREENDENNFLGMGSDTGPHSLRHDLSSLLKQFGRVLTDRLRLSRS